jgi:PAS domain S-box-containing protein
MERQRQAPVVGIVYSLSGRPRVGVGQVCPASRWFLLFLIFSARQQKKMPMPDDGGANVPDGTGSGILDEVTLRALLEHVPVTVYIDRLDETASNVYTSPRLESELGYTVEEWVTDKELYAKVLHPEDRDRILAEYRRTRDTDEPFRAEYRMIARDGTVHWFLDEATVIRDETGQPPTFMVSCSTSPSRRSWRRRSAAARRHCGGRSSTLSHFSRSTPQPSSPSIETGSSRRGTWPPTSSSVTRETRRSGAISTIWSSDEETCAARQ